MKRKKDIILLCVLAVAIALVALLPHSLRPVEKYLKAKDFEGSKAFFRDNKQMLTHLAERFLAQKEFVMIRRDAWQEEPISFIYPYSVSYVIGPAVRGVEGIRIDIPKEVHAEGEYWNRFDIAEFNRTHAQQGQLTARSLAEFHFWRDAMAAAGIELIWKDRFEDGMVELGMHHGVTLVYLRRGTATPIVGLPAAVKLDQAWFYSHR